MLRSAARLAQRSGGAAALELFPEDGFDDDDAEGESDLDPELLEKLDKEVEDFARRLNANWQSPLAAAKVSTQRVETEALAAGVQSLLTRFIQSLGLAKHLQVRT